MPVIFNAAVPLLVSVTPCAALLVPTVCDEKVKPVGATVTAGAVAPVPVKGTVCGLPLALSAMDTDAVRVPDAVGSKVILMTQLADATRLVPQVFVSL